jgi:hypothetical protein
MNNLELTFNYFRPLRGPTKTDHPTVPCSQSYFFKLFFDPHMRVLVPLFPEQWLCMIIFICSQIQYNSQSNK